MHQMHEASAKSQASTMMALFRGALLLFLTAYTAAFTFVPSHHTRRSTFQFASATTRDDVTDNDVCTIQILMSDTGGGHRASANALRDAFDILYPGKIQCDIVDIYTEYGPFWPYNDYVNGYKLMAEYDFLWDAFYHFGATDFGLCLNELLLETFCFEPFKECLNRPSGTTSKRADMVVSVHPLCQGLPLKILAHLDTNGKTRDPNARTTPFATVVTDLGGAHPAWFHPAVDKCFVPSDVLYDCARDRKLQPSQLVEHGLPIRKGFWSTEHNAVEESLKHDKEIAQEKIRLRKELGLDEKLPTVLVVGGGDGMGGIVDIAKALGNKLGEDADEAKYQMVVVCGKNEAAKSTLSSVNWDKGVDVQVQGFVNNMDEWMKASDALVTKAGPGTIAEASICGLPCMLFNYL